MLVTWQMQKKGPNMLKIIVLIPLILCLLWVGYLKASNYSMEQGKQGFIYILVISMAIGMFYSLMLFITH